MDKVTTYWFVSGVLMPHEGMLPFTAFRRKVVSENEMFNIDRLEMKVADEFSNNYGVVVTNFIKLSGEQFELIPGGHYKF